MRKNLRNIGAGGESRTPDQLITKYTTDNALLFHILANAYIYLHLKDTREGKAFLFFTYVCKYELHN